MPLVPGSRLGPYEITGPLGAGGMGEVYKARDTRLERAVAVKVLPSHLLASPEAHQRLEREARMISKLSHPHICSLYDVGHQDGMDFLVMELLEGETLSERLKNGPLPLEQTIRYGVEIANALDAAHRQGIVHRDLKPGNVVLTKFGVKLLDFGLAKAFAPLSPGSNLSELATVPAQHELTQNGRVLGTLQYMAPEQVEGQPADSRSDIFAFGVVLYEMATGRKTFTGKSWAALAGAIVGDEPAAISSLQPMSPPALDRLVGICLAKDPERRWQTAHDIGLQLAAVDESVTQLAPAGAVGRSRAHERWIPWSVATVAVLAAATALGFLLRPGAPPQQDQRTPIKFAVPPPPGGAFALRFLETVSLAVSPEGSHIGFVALNPSGESRIWLRPLSAFDARPLAGTEGATSFFWSPDGRSIAFFAGDKLKRIDLPGGAAVSVCDVQEGIGLFGTWGSGGQILFASVDGKAIFRVATTGGTPIEEITPDRSRGEAKVQWPWFLPDGERFLYQARTPDFGGQLMLAEPGKPPRSLLSVASKVEWVNPDYLVFVRDGTLVGQRLDLSSGRVIGDPFSIAEPVNYFFTTGTARFSTSRNGLLVYQAHSDRARLVWIDRSGREVALVGASANYDRVRISPDGRKAAVDRHDLGHGGYDLWTVDLDRGIATRLTSAIGAEFGGTWLPDGGSVVFSGTDQLAPPHLFRKDLVTGEERQLLPVGAFQEADDVTRDGKLVAFTQRSVRGYYDLWTVSLSGESAPSPLVQSPFDEQGARFSPDGRYVAYYSDESGRYEVYVAPFPVNGGRTRVSAGGGRKPHWRRDGREIFYLSDAGLVSIPIRLNPALELGAPALLFALNGGTTWLDFDVSPDGMRFLAVVPELIADEQPLNVVLNWPAGIGQ